MPRLSHRFHHFPAYPLAHVPQRKRELLLRGVDVIDLGAGDADLAPPAAAVAALQRAAETPALGRYGFGLGHVPFREAIVAWMERRFGTRFDPMAEVVPLIGSKEGLAHVAFAYLGAGDVAIVPEPAYQAYLGGTLMSDAQPFVYPLRPRTNFLVELEELPVDVVNRARVVYLNYPNNPTTAVAPLDYLERTIALCRRYGIVLAYDNAYCDLTFDDYRAPSIFDVPGARDVAIEFFSLSKSFSMTGWRVGFAVGNATLISGLTKVKSYTDTGPFLAIQRAGVVALDRAEALAAPIRDELARRRDAGVAALAAAGFAVDSPRAAMYLWVPLPAGLPSDRFTRFALETEGWDVRFIGADTPYATVVESIRRTKPDLLCVSFTSSAPDKALRRGFASVARAVRSTGGKFLAGGFFAANFTTKELSCDHVASSVTDGIAWVRDAFSLRSGPPKKAVQQAAAR